MAAEEPSEGGDGPRVEDVMEVSGSELTLQEAMNTGLLPQPELMTFNAWQRWRAGPGGRPTLKKGDRYSTSSGEEANLWRTTMEALYGSDWRTDLEDKEVKDAAEKEGEDGEEEEEELIPEVPAAAAGAGSGTLFAPGGLGSLRGIRPEVPVSEERLTLRRLLGRS